MPKTQQEQRAILIGYGEVGRIFADHLDAKGHPFDIVDPVATCTDGGRIVHRGLEEIDISNSLILGVFPSAAALSVAKSIAARDATALYVDLSSSPQATMREAAALFGSRTTDFVDGAIMGSVDAGGVNSPIILSGPASADAARALEQLGFNVRALPNSKAGDACGLKLLRSLLTKGMEALAIECFATAEKMGLSNEVRESLLDVNARPFPDLMDAMVRTHVVHAPRRQYEVAAAIDQARAHGLKAPVSEAVLDAYRKNAARIEAERPGVPATVQEALKWLSKGME